VPTGLRNALIVLLLAAAVYALPGGSDAADFAGSLISTLLVFGFAFAGYRLYRDHRVELYSLGDTHRAMLYGALAGGILAAAGYDRMVRFGSGLQVFVWFVIVGAASWALVVVYRHWRENVI
jgi:hypothetical protein